MLPSALGYEPVPVPNGASFSGVDWFARSFLEYCAVPASTVADLDRLADRCLTGDIRSLGIGCEEELPHIKDKPECSGQSSGVTLASVCGSWKAMKRISCEEKIVSCGYNGSSTARLVQAVKLLVFAPSSGLFTCPLAMTDGAAFVLQKRDRRVFDRLTSTNPDFFFTSGQWMTERLSGSDVNFGTQTIARRVGDTLGAQSDPILGGDSHQAWFELTGNKWFTSATDADVALTLAWIQPSEGKSTKGGPMTPLPETRVPRGELSLFIVDIPAELSSGRLRLLGLKDKLGTRQVPTGEMLLLGCRARLVGSPGRGLSEIMNLANVTRFYNASVSAGYIRRAANTAAEFSFMRRIRGEPISNFPSHQRVIAELEASAVMSAAIVLECGRLMDQDRANGLVDSMSPVTRAVITLAKLFTGKLAVKAVSESIEAIGGLGYLEGRTSAGLSQMLRDAQVLPIWEGTTNVLASDLFKTRSSFLNALCSQYDIPEGLRGLPGNRQDRVRAWAMCLAQSVARRVVLSNASTVTSRLNQAIGRVSDSSDEPEDIVRIMSHIRSQTSFHGETQGKHRIRGLQQSAL